MAASRITNQEVRDMHTEVLAAVTASGAQRDEQLKTLAGEMKGLRLEFRALNGRVRGQGKDITRLQVRVGMHGVNWGRVWQIVAVVMAAILATILAQIGLGG